MDLRDRLSLALLRTTIASPLGRAMVLNQLADAERNGEAEFFDRILRHVDDEKLARLVRTHHADEIRHARRFQERADAQGVGEVAVPNEVKLLDRVDAAMGGLMSSPIATKRGVMEGYLVLQVLEERAIVQFAILERAFVEVDAKTAAVLREITADEERHLRYCYTLARHFAPSTEAHDAFLGYARLVEARAFKANGAANLERFARELFPAGTSRAAFRAVAAITSRLPGLPYTRFATPAASEPTAAYSYAA